MAGFEGPPPIRKTEALLQKLVFELRYAYGNVFLDRCGSILDRILRNYPEWTFRDDQVSPQGAPLVSMENACRFTFGTKSCDFAIERSSGDPPISPEQLAKFTSQVDELTSVVIDQLGLSEYVRIGFRAWFVFGCKNIDAAEDWLRGLGVVQVDPRLLEAFGVDRTTAVSTAVVMEGVDRRFRIGLNTVEISQKPKGIAGIQPKQLHKKQRELRKRLLKQNPETGVMIDIDAYQEDPEVVQPREFVESSYSAYIKALRGLNK